MKLSKIVLSSAAALSLALAVGNTSQADAATTANTDVNVSTVNENHEIMPLINWTGNAYLAKGIWTNVTGSNNFFKDTPEVTNKAGNPGTVKFRILDGKGNVVDTSGNVAVGASVKLGPIKAFAGNYTIQAYTDTAGTYSITVD